MLNRAGFGGKASELDAFANAGLDFTITHLFKDTYSRIKEPEWLSEYQEGFRFRGRMSREERRQFQRKNRQRIHELQMEWIQNMIRTSTPAAMLREKMTFFWHGHFATSGQKVKFPPFIFLQLKFLHENALGNFRDLLHGIVHDPAMLRYLDNNQNRKGHLNENLARELMELFSLGRGNYTEKDVKEAARALTGYTATHKKFRFARRHHDYGDKTFLGKTGNFDGDDIVDIILDQPACAKFITGKILDFLGVQASSELIQSLADEFRDNDYEIKPLLKKIFTHPEFYQAKNVGTQIKSPVQLLVGTARVLEIENDHPEFYLFALNLMGQLPYFPPNVKGWPGGKAWIDTSRLLTRYTFAEIVARGKIPSEADPRSSSDPDRKRQQKIKRRDRMMGMRQMHIDFNPESLLNGEDSPSAILERFEKILLSCELSAEQHGVLLDNFKNYLQEKDRREAMRAILGDIMTLPEYQLC